MNEQDFPHANPFDFRNAIKDDRLLVGRDSEVEEIRSCLTSSASGRPIHIALVGERAAGKTSLLNSAASLAQGMELLPLRLDLDEGVTIDQFTFFRALFEEAVETLLRFDAIAPDDPAYLCWQHQIYLAETPVDQRGILNFGLLAQGKLRGIDIPDISPALLRTDFETIAHRAAKIGRKGVVLLIDEGDLLAARESILIQKLRNLMQLLSTWTLITAGTSYMFKTISDVFSPIPRQFKKIDVGPYASDPQVLECMMAPLKGLKLPTSHEPDPAAASDVAIITGRRPYEINLVCYYIWEALAHGRQARFEPSLDVMNSVLQELRSNGRDLPDVEHIRTLTPDDFETAVEYLPFVELSLGEIALAKLLPNDFREGELETKLAEVRHAASYLESLGLVRVDGGILRATTSPLATVYFRYSAAYHARNPSARRHAQHDLRFNTDYARRVTRHFFAGLTEEFRFPLRQPSTTKRDPANWATRLLADGYTKYLPPWKPTTSAL